MKIIHLMKALSISPRFAKVFGKFFLLLLLCLFPLFASAYSLWGPSASQWKKYAFWYQLRDTFKIDHYTDNPLVRQQINWFAHHPTYLNKLLTDAAPYMFYIFTQVEKRHLPGELVLMPIVESAYDPFAYSDRGAAGLWQLMPGTASGYGLKQDWWYDGRRDIVASTRAALDYLTYLKGFFNGNWLYAIASYNAGEGTVQNAIEYNAHHGKDTDLWNLPLPSQTVAYVPRILALAAIIASPNRYGIHLPTVEDHPYFEPVKIGSQIDLATAAKLAGISIKTLYSLNPGYNRWATDPNGPYLLLIPSDHIKTFETRLKKLPKTHRVSWQRYRVRGGDSLDRIAHQYHTSVALLEEINKLFSNVIHPGEILLIPQNTNSLIHYDFSPELTYAHNRQLKLGPSKVRVTVKPGESLWSIAMKYQVKISQIRFWNHLSTKNQIHPGQKLIIWVEKRTSLPDNIERTRYSLDRVYKVKKGDSLDRIAKAFHSTVDKIKFRNHLNSNILSVGEILKIPPSEPHVHNISKLESKPTIVHYTVKPGDSLSSIAKAHHVAIAKLKKWNKAFLGKYLQPGQILVIYSK